MSMCAKHLGKHRDEKVKSSVHHPSGLVDWWAPVHFWASFNIFWHCYQIVCFFCKCASHSRLGQNVGFDKMLPFTCEGSHNRLPFFGRTRRHWRALKASNLRLGRTPSLALHQSVFCVRILTSSFNGHSVPHLITYQDTCTFVYSKNNARYNNSFEVETSYLAHEGQPAPTVLPSPLCVRPHSV